MAEVIYETQNARSLMERVVIGVEVETSSDDGRDCDSCDICDVCMAMFDRCEICEALGLSSDIADALELPENASQEEICQACSRAWGELDFCDIAREHLCFNLVCENCEGPGYCSAVEELCCARGPYIGCRSPYEILLGRRMSIKELISYLGVLPFSL